MVKAKRPPDRGSDRPGRAVREATQPGTGLGPPCPGGARVGVPGRGDATQPGTGLGPPCPGGARVGVPGRGDATQLVVSRCRFKKFRRCVNWLDNQPSRPTRSSTPKATSTAPAARLTTQRPRRAFA